MRHSKFEPQLLKHSSVTHRSHKESHDKKSHNKKSHCAVTYTELHVTSNFTFLHGGSHPEEYVAHAAALGCSGIALTDTNTFAGIVRAHGAARAHGIPFIVGTHLVVQYESAFPVRPVGDPMRRVGDPMRRVGYPVSHDGCLTNRDGGEKQIFLFSLLAYPMNREAYGRLCRLLTQGKLRAASGSCVLCMQDLVAIMSETAFILIPPGSAHSAIYAPREEEVSFFECAKFVYEHLPDKKVLSLALTRNYSYSNLARQEAALQVAQYLRVPVVATNSVLYHLPERRPLQDVVSCIRMGCTVQQAGVRLCANAERHLKSPEEMQRLFRDLPHAIRRTAEVQEMVQGFSLDQLKYSYPEEVSPRGVTPLEYLTELTYRGAKERYPQGVPEKVKRLLSEELTLIHELEYEKYFLTCHDIVRFARERGILCQGRGAAANSAVCYCLGITAVDPATIDLLFARFVSKERNEPPDIDIDFEHERREEVIQYLYTRFGRERAGLTCEVVTYRQRSAIREVGKALGLSLDIVDALAKNIHRWTAYKIPAEELQAIGINPEDRTIHNALRLSEQILGFPRHLSQHVGGFIISDRPLCESVPILNASMEDRTIIEWDKDDIETLGMLKIDVLGLGMLTCVRKALNAIADTQQSQAHRVVAEQRGVQELAAQRFPAQPHPALSLRGRDGFPSVPLQLHQIPQEDPRVYDMICASDTVGVFQIESRAQMSMLPRLQPRCFYDLVIEVAIVRPGPIQGNMVHPFLKRRSGVEQVHYPDERVAQILGKTMGVPIFQEQAMRLAIVLAEFTPGEAERLRRAMAAWKRNKGLIATFEERIIAGMLRNGYTREYAQSCVQQIKGFSEYGFPESHAASFALIVYASAWIKCYYPAHFALALLNSQPMGFYAPSQIVADAKAHGVPVRAVDVNYSRWDCTLESAEDENGKEYLALRLGFRMIRGMKESQGALIAAIVRERGRLQSIHQLWHCSVGGMQDGLSREASAGSSAPDPRTPPPSHGGKDEEVRGDTRIEKRTLQLLARADAFKSLGVGRRQALWEIQALPPDPAPLEAMLTTTPPTAPEVERSLPLLSRQQSMFRDYRATGLSLRAHPVQFLREELIRRGVTTAEQIRIDAIENGAPVAVAGLSIVRQRPGTAKGVVFLTLEDESGMANLIVRPEVFEKFQRIIINSNVLLARGTLQKLGLVIYVNTSSVESLDAVVFTERRVGGGAERGPGVEYLSYSY